jgi:photosystem II PsbZ protein
MTEDNIHRDRKNSLQNDFFTLAIVPSLLRLSFDQNTPSPHPLTHSPTHLPSSTQFLVAYSMGYSDAVLAADLSLYWEENMAILFQLALAALVIMSFVMVVGVPVAYASPRNWEQSKRLILLGSGLWVVLVLLVGGLNYFVV